MYYNANNKSKLNNKKIQAKPRLQMLNVKRLNLCIFNMLERNKNNL